MICGILIRQNKGIKRILILLNAIDNFKFVEFIRDEANIPNLVELDADKRGFVINDLAKPKVIEKIIIS